MKEEQESHHKLMLKEEIVENHSEKKPGALMQPQCIMFLFKQSPSSTSVHLFSAFSNTFQTLTKFYTCMHCVLTTEILLVLPCVRTTSQGTPWGIVFT